MNEINEQAKKKYPLFDIGKSMSMSDEYVGNEIIYIKRDAFNEGFEICQKNYEEKLRWISVEKKLPPVGVELLCKIERLSWTDNKYAVGIFNENRVWSIEGRHITHYKDAVNNCVTHYREII
jgi:hypothetical protein